MSLIASVEELAAQIETANAGLDELIFALHARLMACREVRAKQRQLERQRERAPISRAPNLWWVGGVIPLSFLGPGSQTFPNFGGGGGGSG
jgi:hypothetical protein